MISMYEREFNQSIGGEQVKLKEQGSSDGKSLSVEDKRFLEIMEEEAQLKNNHYVLPIPFRSKNLSLPNNNVQAVQRLNSLKKRLLKNSKEREDYQNFMKEIFDKGYVEKIDTPPLDGRCWYVPHFPVYHPKKPDKVRVVFDCSVKYNGRCLNEEILQGPDLTNLLVGVLCRFREQNFAVMADLEKMFYQVQIPEKHRDFFRFLWWNDGNLEGKLEERRMVSHLQGCISSPSCANYALQRTGDDNIEMFRTKVANVFKEKLLC